MNRGEQLLIAIFAFLFIVILFEDIVTYVDAISASVALQPIFQWFPFLLITLAGLITVYIWYGGRDR